MNNDFENIVISLDFEIPTGSLDQGCRVLLPSALEGEQGIAAEHQMHLEIQQELQQEIPFTEKPAPRKRKKHLPIQGIVSASDDFITHDNISRHYPNDVDKVIEIWDALVGKGANRIDKPYHQIMAVEKRVMDVVLQNAQAFQYGLDWTSEGLMKLLPEHFSLSRYSSEWFLFARHESKKIMRNGITSSDFASQHQTDIINEISNMGLNQATVCVSGWTVEGKQDFSYFFCDCVEDTFKPLTPEQTQQLPCFEAQRYIWTDFQSNDLKINHYLCVPNPHTPHQLALVWTDEPEPSFSPLRIQLKESDDKPREEYAYKAPDISDFDFLGDKAQKAFAWYVWHVEQLQALDVHPGPLSQFNLSKRLVFLDALDKLYKASPKRHALFVDVFLKRHHDWSAFLDSENIEYIHMLCKISTNELTWCDSIFRQHAGYNEHVDFSEMMDAYLYFLQYLQKQDLTDSLPDICGITDIKHMKPALFRLITLLSHADDPKRQLQHLHGLDFGPYGFYYVATDGQQYFEMLTSGMALTPSGTSTHADESKLSYTLKSNDMGQYVHLEYASVSAIYYRLLNIYDSPRYRRIFDYDLYCRLEQMIRDCGARDEDKVRLLHYTFRHTRGVDKDAWSKESPVHPGLIEPSLRITLQRFGLIPSENIARFQHLNLQDLAWLNAIKANYIHADDMPSLVDMDKILCLAEVALDNLKSYAQEQKINIFKLLLSSVTLPFQGLDKHSLALLFHRIERSPQEKQLTLYRASSDEDEALGLLDVLVGLFNENMFRPLISQCSSESDFFKYTIYIGQLLMCIDLGEKTYFKREDITNFLTTLEPVTNKFISEKYVSHFIADLLGILRTIDFTHSPLLTFQNITNILLTMNNQFKWEYDKNRLHFMLDKECPNLILVQKGGCDWNGFDLEKCKINEKKLGIQYGFLSKALDEETFTAIKTLGQSIEEVQQQYASNSLFYRRFLDAIQSCDVRINPMLPKLIQLIKYCHQGIDVENGGNASAAASSIEMMDKENHLVIFPQLCKMLNRHIHDESWLDRCRQVFALVQELQALTKQQRENILIQLCQTDIKPDDVNPDMRCLNDWANSFETSPLAGALLDMIPQENVWDMIEYIRQIQPSLSQYAYSKHTLCRLLTDLLGKTDKDSQLLLTSLLKGGLSSEKIHVLCIYHAQAIPLKKMCEMLELFSQTQLSDKDWHDLFIMQPYPQYQFMFKILNEKNKALALEKIRRFDIEPHGVSLNPGFFQISREEKNRLMRVFSQINNLSQDIPLDFATQKRLLQDYLTMTITHGPDLARLSRDELKNLWMQCGFGDGKLKKLAIMREIYRRVTGNFPYCTQMLTLLLLDEVPGHILFQLETGQGKSIVMALSAVYLFTQQSGSKSVYIASRNRDLGQQDYIGKQTREFIRAFDIDCPDDLIVPALENPCKTPGIYYFYSSPGVSLTQSLQQFVNNPDFLNAHLILDEFDDTVLNDLTAYNVTVNVPQLQQASVFYAWSSRYIIDFYDAQKDNSLLLEHDLKLTDAIRAFLLSKALHEEQKNFVRKLSHQTLLDMFLAAHTSAQYQEGKEYVVHEIKANLWRALPMRKGEPQKGSIFSKPWVHIFQHARLEKQYPDRTFEILPKTVNIGSATSKTMVDKFSPSSQCRVIGLTATAGVFEEVKELTTKYQMTAIKIQPYHANQRVIKPTILVSSTSDIFTHLHQMIQEQTYKGQARQPIYIYCADGKIAKQYYEYLKNDYSNIQLINGQETEEDRARRIQSADLDNMITVTTLLLLRGIDFQPSEAIGQQKGGFLIQTFLSHHRDTNQVQGRVARNGKAGTYQLLLDVNAIPFWKDVQAPSEEERLNRCRALINKAEAIQRHYVHAMDDVRQILLDAQDKCFDQLASSQTFKTEDRETLLRNLDKFWEQVLKDADPDGRYVNNPFCRYHQGNFEISALDTALVQFRKMAFEFWTAHANAMIKNSRWVEAINIPSYYDLEEAFHQQQKQQVYQHATNVMLRFSSMRLEIEIDEWLWLEKNVPQDQNAYLLDMHVKQLVTDYNEIISKINLHTGFFNLFWHQTPCLKISSNPQKDLELLMAAMKQLNDKVYQFHFLPLIFKLHLIQEKYQKAIPDKINSDINALTNPAVTQVTLYLKQAILQLSWHKNCYSFYYWLATKAIRDIAHDIESQPLDSADDLNKLNETLKTAQQTLQNMSFQWLLWGHHDTLARVNCLLEHVETLKPYQQEIVAMRV